MHKNSPPRLIALVGLPRSGKSTLAAKYAQLGYAVVCADNVRLALHGQRFAPQAEPMVWAITRIMVDALILSGNKVVIDSTNLTREQRKPWAVRGATFHIVRSSLVDCLKRAKKLGDGGIVPIIQRMARDAEPVLADEGSRTDQTYPIGG